MFIDPKTERALKNPEIREETTKLINDLVDQGWSDGDAVQHADSKARIRQEELDYIDRLYD